MPDTDLFEASLLLLAGAMPLHPAIGGRGGDLWAALCADARLRAEFEGSAAAIRFADVMRAVPEARCWIHGRVAGIRFRSETFVVDVDGAEPSTVVRRLRGEWARGARGLLADGPADEPARRARAAAVWRCALLTAAPKMSARGLRLRTRDRSSAALLLRAAQLLGVRCEASRERRSRIVHVDAGGALTLLSTVGAGSAPGAPARADT